MKSHGGNPWALLERGEEVADFSADLNPYGPPPGLETVLWEAADRITLYPEPTYRDLRETLSGLEQVAAECILPGNGTADLIHLISRRFKAKRALVIAPTFTEYERAVAADGGVAAPCLLREERGFSAGSLEDPEPLLRDTQFLYLCNPNNPTGTLWPEALLRRWLEACNRSGVTAVVDEAYLDFVEPSLRCSAVRWVEEFSNLIVLRSMTKIFAVPGLRIGYAVASPPLAESLGQAQPPWSVNSLAVRIGTWLAGQGAYREECRQSLERAKRQLETGLLALPGLKPYPSEANFFLCRLAGPAGPVAEKLADRGIMVRRCDDFTGLERDRFIRIAVRTPEENEKLLRALEEVLPHGG